MHIKEKSGHKNLKMEDRTFSKRGNNSKREGVFQKEGNRYHFPTINQIFIGHLKGLVQAHWFVYKF